LSPELGRFGDVASSQSSHRLSTLHGAALWPRAAAHLTAQLGGFASRSGSALADIYTEQPDTPLVASLAQTVHDHGDQA
jgi:hypothetical protein